MGSRAEKSVHQNREMRYIAPDEHGKDFIMSGLTCEAHHGKRLRSVLVLPLNELMARSHPWTHPSVAPRSYGSTAFTAQRWSMTAGPHGRPPGRIPRVGFGRESDPDTQATR